ncbi:predicted protein [Sclerotinia sclerotiorum 1980 UF-70]|uniref:Uncharacterized protein n=1 Tax=Sclerotinia sclerotiorum (strain ATCC 18683 / 1980 / Ss-1) TaxID=665079 RepID=A7E5X9_SCLS1|nr:predicted protein [Sclerotinia sclerotiorum 1980 UF-70]EDN91301.1 predicted protein [Sclerotinia sclerotiorum 1980 UF-70]
MAYFAFRENWYLQNLLPFSHQVKQSVEAVSAAFNRQETAEKISNGIMCATFIAKKKVSNRDEKNDGYDSSSLWYIINLIFKLPTLFSRDTQIKQGTTTSKVRNQSEEFQRTPGRFTVMKVISH